MKYNSNEIEGIIPHRYPFLLIDKIIDGEKGEWAKGIKCVTANEYFFQGHFPGYKVMPGVLIIEALAQVGAVAILTLDEFKGKIVLFGGIKKAKFKRQIIPGDVLELECRLTKRRGSVGFGEAIAKVGEEVAVTAELTFFISDN